MATETNITKPEDVKVWGINSNNKEFSEFEKNIDIKQQGYKNQAGFKEPTSNVMNSIFNELYRFVLDNNKHGLNTWDITTQYPIKALVHYQDEVYVSLIENIAVTPTSGITTGDWRVANLDATQTIGGTFDLPNNTDLDTVRIGLTHDTTPITYDVVRQYLLQTNNTYINEFVLFGHTLRIGAAVERYIILELTQGRDGQTIQTFTCYGDTIYTIVRTLASNGDIIREYRPTTSLGTMHLNGNGTSINRTNGLVIDAAQTTDYWTITFGHDVINIIPDPILNTWSANPPVITAPVSSGTGNKYSVIVKNAILLANNRLLGVASITNDVQGASGLTLLFSNFI